MKAVYSKKVSALLAVAVTVSTVGNIYLPVDTAAAVQYGTNADILGKMKLTGMSDVETNEWGKANSGSVPYGEWEIIEPSYVKQNYLGGGWASIWHKMPNAPQFKVTAQVKLNKVGDSSPYPKYGFYGAYKDEGNYVLGLIDVAFNSFATFTRVDGLDVGWKSSPLPPGIDLTSDTIELKSIKIGDTVKFYVDGFCVQTVDCPIGDAQPGLLTEDAQVEFFDYKVDTSISTFDETKELPRLGDIFGQAAVGTFSTGDWSIDNQGVISQNVFNPGWNSIYYGNELRDTYQFEIDVKLNEISEGAEFPKYGIYPYYKDGDNFVVAMIDPKNQLLATYARINGQDMEWQGSAIGAIDYNQYNQIKVTKVGDTIDFYVNDTLVQSRAFEMGAGQPGLIVEECKASYKNYKFGDVQPDNRVWKYSYDGAVPVIGNWVEGNNGSISQIDITDYMTATFYKDTVMKDYTATLDMQVLEVGNTEFPKYGVYAGHESGESFVWAFLHPKEGIISTYAKVDGVDMGWNLAPLPAGFDYTKPHQLKVVKKNNVFQFFVDGSYLLSREANIGEAQFGLTTYDCAAKYSNFNIVQGSQLHTGSIETLPDIQPTDIPQGWQESYDKVVPVIGNWEKNKDGSITQTNLTQDMTALFYGNSTQENYSAKVTLKAQEVGSTEYPKYGVYAGHASANDFVWTFLHPKEGIISTYAKVDGVDMGWDSAPLPANFDFTEEHQLEVAKIGNEFRFYVDGTYMLSREAEIGAAQFGLVTYDCSATYKDVVLTSIQEFDDNKDNVIWAGSYDGQVPIIGDWKEQEDTSVVQGTLTEEMSALFYANPVLKNYSAKVTATLEEIGESDYPKYGVYAGYESSESFVWAFIHPKEGILSTYAKVDGIDMGWNSAALPKTFDYEAEHELEIAKVGSEFRFYVDGEYLLGRHADIEKAQFGVVTFDTNVHYKNPSVIEIKEFDPNKSSALWAGSYDGTVPVIGNWVKQNNGYIEQTDITDYMTAIFYDNKAQDNYEVKVKLKATEVGATPFPKYGVYAGHHSADSFVWVFLHPKENIISSYARVNGEDMGWNMSLLPQGFDFTQEHELKITKQGKYLRFFIDGTHYLSRRADIGNAQFGLTTFDCAAAYSEPVITPIGEYVPTVSGGGGSSGGSGGGAGGGGTGGNHDGIDSLDWGKSYDGTVPVIGSWTDSKDGVVTQNNLTNYMTAVFYEGTPKENYEATTIMKATQIGTSDYPKYGIYAGHNSPDNFVWVFLHPKEGIISSYAKVNGEDMGWTSAPLPSDFDFTQEHEIKTIKIGNEFRFYIDGKYVIAREANIGAAQYGLSTYDCKASYRNTEVKEATDFDQVPTTQLWRPSYDYKKPVVGKWEEVDLTTIKQTDLGYVAEVFYGNTLKENYKATVKMKVNQTGANPYAKIGMYAAYASPQDMVQAYIHPKEGIISSVAIVDGVFQGWNSQPLPEDFDFEQENEFKTIKIGNEFRFYVNGKYLLTRVADIKDAQVGLITDDCQATFKELTVEDAEVFDESIEAKWGNAADGKGIVLGDYWEENGNSISQTQIDEAVNQIFYMQKAQEDYKFVIDMKPLKIGEENPYAKYGVYAAYEDELNYVQIFMHPKEGFMTVSAMANGQIVLNFEKVYLPTGFDYSADHQLKVIKIGSEFRIYVDEDHVYTFNADIRAAQVGVITEGVQMQYSNIACVKADGFDEKLWDKSYDMKKPVRGQWEQTEEGIRQIAVEESVNEIFYNQPLKEDYKFTLKMKPIEIGESDIAKYGVYAGYENENNYAQVYIHLKEGFLSTHINEAWTVVQLSKDFDYTAEHEMQIIKIGSEFRVYIDGVEVHRFNLQMGAAQVGIITEAVSGEYSQISYEQMNQFDEPTWNASYDKIIPASGSWEVIPNGIKKTHVEENWSEIFYDKQVLKENYRFTTTIEPVAMGAHPYAKIGVYAGYESLSNYAQVFIHLKEKFLSTNINGTWNIVPLPADFDYTVAHEMKIIKIGSEFKVYIDELEVHAFGLEMGKAQVGVITEAVQGIFDNVQYEDAYAFDESIVKPEIPVTTGPAIDIVGPGIDGVEPEIPVTTGPAIGITTKPIIGVEEEDYTQSESEGTTNPEEKIWQPNNIDSKKKKYFGAYKVK